LSRNVENTSKSVTAVSGVLYQCTKTRYIVRDFVYSEDALEKQREELETADTTEKELWVSSCVYYSDRDLTVHRVQTELLRLSRTNFSEAFQILVHLKVIRLFVESVLRYGLPANYIGLVVKVCSFTMFPLIVTNVHH
jgi:V-type H+-transporting ATPase subunit C